MKNTEKEKQERERVRKKGRRNEIERERENVSKLQNPKNSIMCTNICEKGVQTKRNK